MSDDAIRALRLRKQELRASHGMPCHECVRLLPKASPSILLPQQRCKVHGYRDPRERTAENSYLIKVTA